MKVKKNKSEFLKKFGDSPKLRVWDFLIENNFHDFPLTEIARESNISYNSIKAFFFQMVKDNFVIKTRKVGKADFYQLNTKNSDVKLLIKLDWELTKRALKPQSNKISVAVSQPKNKIQIPV